MQPARPAGTIDPSPRRGGPLRGAVLAVAAIVVAWWAIELLDTYLLGDRLQRNGIHPRSVGGLDGILWAPLLHSDFAHLVSNTFPFVILSALVMIRGIRRWIVITALGIVAGGLLTWIIARGGNHIGASGVVFTYFGALLGAAWFERRPAAIAPALVAMLLYTTMLIGLVPQAGISWEGHLSGFLVGIGASKFLAVPRVRRDPDADVDDIFDGRQPWLDV